VRRDEPHQRAAERLTGYLARLSDIDAAGRPGWFISPNWYPAGLDWYPNDFPHGMYNLGLAHGAPGILRALSASVTAGISAEHASRGVLALVGDLRAARVAGHDAHCWSAGLQAQPGTGLPVFQDTRAPARATWCYGAPGIAAALLTVPGWVCDVTDLAAPALLAAFHGLAAGPADPLPGVLSPTACHGLSGSCMIALTALRARADPADSDADFWREVVATLAAQILGHSDHGRRYLFADRPEAGRACDDPGLLTGAAGVLCTLVSLISAEAAEDPWLELLCGNPFAGGRW
jgi:hypothetical protein